MGPKDATSLLNLLTIIRSSDFITIEVSANVYSHHFTWGMIFLGNGMTTDVFQIVGIVHVSTES